MSASKVRIEKDTFGPIEVPADRLWGAQTQRSRQNFAISSERMPLALIHALVLVKKAAAILLRPLLPPDQDFTSSGPRGRYMVIRRLLPLFDQYAPDTASALRAQLTALSGEQSKKFSGDDENSLLTKALQPEDPALNSVEELQDRIDHARSSAERRGRRFSTPTVSCSTFGAASSVARRCCATTRFRVSRRACSCSSTAMPTTTRSCSLHSAVTG